MRPSLLRHSRNVRILSTSASLLVAAAGLARADLNWDTLLNNGAINGGTGVWNLLTPNWTANGASNVVWNSTGAIFGGTPGIVTISVPSGDVSATGLIFNTAGYEISSDTGDGNATDDALTLTGTPTIAANANATIRAILAGAVPIGLTGAGTLTLTNTANTFTGGINIAGGTLALAGQGSVNPTILGAGAKAITLTGGGTLRITSGTFDPTSGTKSVAIGAGGGTFTVDNGASATLIDSGQLTAASGETLTKSGNGSLTISGTQSGFLGKVAINGGRVTLSSLTGLGASAANTITVNPGSIFVLGTSDDTGAAAYNNALVNSVTLAGGLLIPTSGAQRAIKGAVTLQAGTTSTLRPVDFNSQLNRTFVRIVGKMTGSGALRVEAPDLGYPANNRATLIFSTSATDLTSAAVISIGDNTAISGGATTNGSGTAVTGGRAFGDARLVLNGRGPRIVMNDEGTGSDQTIVWNNAVDALTDGRISARNRTASTNNKIALGALTVTGNRTLQFDCEQGNYSVGFGNGGVTSTLAGNATFFTTEEDGTFTTANVVFDGPVVESGGARNITKASKGALTFNDVASHTGATNVLGGALTLSGANGKVTASAGLNVRSGSIFTYDNAVAGSVTTLTTTATPASLIIDNAVTNVANRLADTIPVALSNATLSLRSNIASAISAAETVGTVTLSGASIIDATRGNAGASSVLTLGAISRAATDGTAIFTGQNLGTAGNNSRILVSGLATSGYAGAWATTPGTVANNNDWLRYDSALGFIPFGAGNYVNDPAVFASGTHAKLTGTATTTLAADAAVASLNFQGTATRTIALGGNALTVEQGGILVNDAEAALTGTASGGLTAGTTSAAADLIVTDNGTTADAFTIGARITNNAAGGAVRFVKAGDGRTILDGSNPNTHTGGSVVNAGFLESRDPSTFPTNTPVIVAGGQLDLRNDADAAYANPFTVSGDATIRPDGLFFGFGNTISLGSLAIGPHTLRVPGGSSYVLSVAGATTLTGSATFAVDSTGTLRNLGAIGDGGGAFSLTKNGRGLMTIGGGSGDTAANTFTGGVVVNAGTLILNKAPGTVSVPGNITLNGGSTSGTALTLDANEQIGDTADVTINGGIINVRDEFFTGVSETIGALTVRGGGYVGFFNTATNGSVQLNSAGSALSVSALNLAHQGGVTVMSLYSGTTGTEGRLTLRGPLTLSGATNTSTSATVIGVSNSPFFGDTRGTIDLDGGQRTFTIADIGGVGEELRIDARIANGSIVKAGGGRLALTATEGNQLGSVRIDAGELVARSTDFFTTPLGTGTAVLNGGRLLLAFNGSGSSGTVDNNANTGLAVIADSSLDVNRINGSNTGNRVGVSSLDLAASTLSLTGGNGYSLEVLGDTTVSGASGVNLGANLRVSTISGTGTLTKSGAGILEIGGNATLGGLVINEGTVTLGVPAPAPAPFFEGAKNGSDFAEAELVQNAAAVPEPGIAATVFSGIAALFAQRRRRS